MKKIDDSRLYLFFGLTVLLVALLAGIPSLYSRYSIEPGAKLLLGATKNVDKKYKKAYVLLRDAQIFARYEHFDSDYDLKRQYLIARTREFEQKKSLDRVSKNTYPGSAVKYQIIRYDRLIYEGKKLKKADQNYIEALLNRRQKGSQLGINTSVFFFLLAVISFLFFFLEKRQLKKLQES